MQPFFVVGCPRSGTTMLQEALNRHSRVAIPPETSFFVLLRSGRRGQGEHRRRLNADLGIDLPPPPRGAVSPEGARAYHAELAGRYLRRLGRTDVTHFGEKSPEHQRYLGDVGRLLPGAKVVLVYRDGRDVALSRSKVPWAPPGLYANFAVWLHYLRLQRAAVRAGTPPLLCVRYEDLVADPEKGLRAVLAFLGLPYEPAVALGDGSGHGIADWERAWKWRAAEKIGAGRVGVWREELSRAEVGILEHWGGAALRSLGYDLLTDGRHPLPWFFLPRVYARVCLWALRRPSYGTARGRSGGAGGAAPQVAAEGRS